LQTLVTLGNLKDYHIWLSLLGLVAIGTLLFHQVRERGPRLAAFLHDPTRPASTPQAGPRGSGPPPRRCLTSFFFIWCAQVKGGVLLGIVVLTLVVWGVDRSWPGRVADLPSLRLGVTENIDLTSWSLNMLPAVLAFLLVGVFDVSGVMFGLSALAHKTHEPREHHHVPGRCGAQPMLTNTHVHTT
jgi:xanthine/uracil/vitamin C permease (AzgA family)